MLVRRILIGVLFTAFCFGSSWAYNKSKLSLLSFLNRPAQEDPVPSNGNTIQVALLLDTSGSMSGLIEQAKSQLWNILNELARTEKEDQETELEIALYEYGNSNRKQGRIQINQLSEFTSDMDMISEKLFALTTSGGDEYCGAVIKSSIDDLTWKNDNGLKVIYIAGNEPFTQGHVSYTTACNRAKGKGVVVNTIYCGDYNTGIKEYWMAGAKAGGGEYLHIDHNQETAYIETPFDDEINQLNERLNKTYIPYGNQGQEKLQKMNVQDGNASKYSKTNAANRAVFKSSKKYKAESWDVVDAYKKDKSILKKAKIQDDTLSNLSIEDLEAKIQQAASERETVQTQIQELDKKRRDYKKEKMKSSKTESEKSLEKQMLNSVRKQAKEKGFKVKE